MARATVKTPLPLVGLIEEAILVPEERELRAPAVEVPTLVALAARPPKQVCAVTVASAAEIPAFVVGRWATLCDVRAASEESIVLRARSRVRITSVNGKEAPCTAEVEDGSEDRADAKALLDAAHGLFGALRQGARPLAPRWEERLREAVAGAVRAVSTREELRAVQGLPLEEAASAAARALAATIAVERATGEIEAMLAEAVGRELSAATRKRLWSHVVEIQKKLDVYDPGAGDNVDDLMRLQRRLQQAGLPKEAREVAKRELRLLRGMESNHHDFAPYHAHLDLMARLSWHPETLPPVDLDLVQRRLDEEHAGLEKPKRRVLEHLAVRKLGGASKSMVLCLAGPPGVGKTTLARVVAESLGRSFVRVALGGVHDESEVRGHRRSFVAAGPGRIVAGFARAGTATPVVLLDEIDKIGTDTQRSVAAALLEVLDPEQHTHFSDNFLEVPYDLSHAVFVTTANDTSRIHPILLDRLEVVELDGYTADEKIVIARKHLLERMRADAGLPEPLRLDDALLALVVEGHTREAGVRQLQRALAALCRDKALDLARGRAGATLDVTAGDVARVLGARLQEREGVRGDLPAGTAMGLSVSGDGGALLFIEVVALPGGPKLRMTGRLGDVMRETTRAALAYLRGNARRHGIEPGALEREFHLHVPEASIAKEGPSAGLAVLAAFASAASGVPLPADVAMTGEVSLTGRVLGVGGLRAKLLAADRAGVGRVLVPQANVHDVPAGVRARVIPVSHAQQAMEVLLPATRSSLAPPPPPARRAGRPDAT